MGINTLPFTSQNQNGTGSEITVLLVRGSYDPNDKFADPPGAGPDHNILPNVDIKYTIRFQSTGNDTAFAEVIRDTLDSSVLDISTLIPGASSHPYSLQVLNGNVLEFMFAHISLADSIINIDASQGYVSYRISQQENLPLETIIENSASIYFDNNPVITTNTYGHVVRSPSRLSLTSITVQSTEESIIRIFPISSAGKVSIQHDLPIHEVIVLDIYGRKIDVHRVMLKLFTFHYQAPIFFRFPSVVYTAFAKLSYTRVG